MVSYSTTTTDKSYTLTGLKRWCCNDPAVLPDVASVRELHVYDFDNTLFQTALPNRSLWDPATWGRLQGQEMFANGGWWHNVAVLAATGDGIDVEEARAWAGHWNEQIVELVKLSMRQDDVLTVLLTGRAEEAFAELIQRICRSRQLEFDIYALKPWVSPTGRAPSTMAYKQDFLTSLMRTYSSAGVLRLYEDRVKHVRDFETFLNEFTESVQHGKIPRVPLDARVIQVNDPPGVLQPVAEAAAIQQAINEHNDMLRAATSQGISGSHKPLRLIKTTLYTAYQIKSQQDSDRLLSLVKLPEGAETLAKSILITTYPAHGSIIQRAGGMGKTFRFEVVSVGFLKSKIWAVQVKSVGATAYTTLSQLVVVLALNDGGRPHEAKLIKEWHPLPANAGFQFDAVVSDVFRLKVEEEQPAPRHDQAPMPQKRQQEPLHGQVPTGPQYRANGTVKTAYRGRGGANGYQARAEYRQPRGAATRGRGAPRGRARGTREVSGRQGYKDHDAATGPARGGNGDVSRNY